MVYLENYRQVKRLQPDGIREQIRKRVLTGLAAVNSLNGLNQSLLRPRVQFLYLHHVFHDEEQRLEELLQRLSADHVFISYSEAVARAISGDIDQPYITFSFDDGFKNNLKAAKILNDYNASACFFLNPAIIGEIEYNVIEKYCRNRLNFPPVEFLSWQDVEQIQQWGHEIGGHTMDHKNMAEISREEITRDLIQCTLILKDRCGQISHFAFPYGRYEHFSETGRKAVFDAGYQSCASVVRGCHFPHNKLIPHSELCILRDHIILDWNQDHIIYFIGRNAKKVSFDYTFPYKNFEII